VTSKLYIKTDTDNNSVNTTNNIDVLKTLIFFNILSYIDLSISCPFVDLINSNITLDMDNAPTHRAANMGA
jgi:hypothetical protein